MDIQKLRESICKQDFIWCVAPISAGKSTLREAFIPFLERRNIRHTLITDYESLQKALKDDHRDNRGRFHTHPREQEDHYYSSEIPYEHAHLVGDAKGEFTFTNTDMVKKSDGYFFEALSRLLHDGTVYLIEWAVGENGLEKDHELASVDFSLESRIPLLQKYPDIIERTRVVLHVETPYEEREINTNTRNASGESTEYRSQTATQFTRHDDSYLLHGIFEYVTNLTIGRNKDTLYDLPLNETRIYAVYPFLFLSHDEEELHKMGIESFADIEERGGIPTFYEKFSSVSVRKRDGGILYLSDTLQPDYSQSRKK